MNGLQKRREQLLQWNDCETNRASEAYKQAQRVDFDRSVQFLAACSSADMDEVKRLLQEGIDINVGNVDGLTALHQACIDSNMEMVQFLVENKADTNVPDREGWTPLHAAASCGFLEIVKYLVEHGGRLDALTYENELPLNITSTDERDVSVYLEDAMKERGIDVEEAKSLERRVMLEDAKRWAAGAAYKPPMDPIVKATPLHIAASKDYINVMEVLFRIKQVDVNATDNDGWTPLHAAAHYGHQKACELLLEHGANIHAVSYTNQTIESVADANLHEYLKTAQATYKANKSKFIDHKSMLDDWRSQRQSDDKQRVSDLGRTEARELRRESGFITQEESITTPAVVTDENKEKKPSRDLSSDQEKNENTKPEPPHINTLPSDENALNENGAVVLRDRSVMRLRQEVQPSHRMSAILSPLKGDETEAQRTQKARQARASRRSTQGVTLEDIEEAKRMGTPTSAGTTGAASTTRRTEVASAPDLTALDVPSNAVSDKKESQNDNSCIVVSAAPAIADKETSPSAWLRSRESRRPANSSNAATTPDQATATVAAAGASSPAAVDSSFMAALPQRSSTRAYSRRTAGVTQAESTPTTTTTNITSSTQPVTDTATATSPMSNGTRFSRFSHQQPSSPSGGGSGESLDYEQLYHKVEAENKRLTLQLSECQKELEKYKSAFSSSQSTADARHQVMSQKLSDLEEKQKEYERLSAENAKLKESNQSLVNVIRRLSQPIVS